MNDADLALYQQAQAIANSGQLGPACQIFRRLHSRNPDIEILFGIATTTPDPEEARLMIDQIKRLSPNHPMLHQLEMLHNRKIQETYVPTVGPVLLCPYCGQRTSARIKRNISVGGWVWFAAFFLFFLACMFVPVPIAFSATEGDIGLVCLVVGIIGLFVIRKRIYLCGNCGSKIADAH